MSNEELIPPSVLLAFAAKDDVDDAALFMALKYFDASKLKDAFVSNILLNLFTPFKFKKKGALGAIYV